MTLFYSCYGGYTERMAEAFFDRRILGRKHRGVRIDPQTRQTVQFAKHSGDIVYPLKGSDTIAKKSEFRDLTRERTLNPCLEPTLNEIGQNKNIIKRTAKSRYVKLDK